MKTLAQEIESRTGINVFNCYQCGKCSAGCVFSYLMDTPPHLLMRYIQLDMREKALSSNTFFGCGACVTCSFRCPREIDVLRVINTVKSIAMEGKILPRNKSLEDVRIFDKIFLDNIVRNERADEFSLGLSFNLKSGKLLKDVSLLPVLSEKDKFAVKEKAASRNIKKVVNKLK
ncbi:MAG: 4Fe-4S dicluster domain-containing protein [bacterium]